MLRTESMSALALKLWIYISFARFSTILVAGLIVMAEPGCTPGEDKVFGEFEWLLDANCAEERWKMVNRERNWHVTYRLSNEDMEKMLSDEFGERGFLGWKRFSGMTILYGGYTLNGERENIFVNEKVGSNEYDRIRLYIEIDKQYLTLEYGITSGL